MAAPASAGMQLGSTAAVDDPAISGDRSVPVSFGRGLDVVVTPDSSSRLDATIELFPEIPAEGAIRHHLAWLVLDGTITAFQIVHLLELALPVSRNFDDAFHGRRLVFTTSVDVALGFRSALDDLGPAESPMFSVPNLPAGLLQGSFLENGLDRKASLGIGIPTLG